MGKPESVPSTAWQALRQLTAARVALGRVGASLPTRAILEFGIAQARARDAVHSVLDIEPIEADLRNLGLGTLRAHSRAPSRHSYLHRPDLGRQLDETSRAALLAHTDLHGQEIVFVIADGLSAVAPQRHAASLLKALLPQLDAWRIGPAVIAEQARVALGDEIGQTLHASWVVVLIGERPGLSAPDSLGIYFTYRPCVGRTDAERNCISNIHAQGLGYANAAAKLAQLLRRSRQLSVSGIALKDEAATLLTSTE